MESLGNLKDWARKNKLNDTTISVLKREDVDFDTLILLSPDELKELGLTLGQRNRVEAAVLNLKQQSFGNSYVPCS